MLERPMTEQSNVNLFTHSWMSPKIVPLLTYESIRPLCGIPLELTSKLKICQQITNANNDIVLLSQFLSGVCYYCFGKSINGIHHGKSTYLADLTRPGSLCRIQLDEVDLPGFAKCQRKNHFWYVCTILKLWNYRILVVPASRTQLTFLGAVFCIVFCVCPLRICLLRHCRPLCAPSDAAAAIAVPQFVNNAESSRLLRCLLWMRAQYGFLISAFICLFNDCVHIFFNRCWVQIAGSYGS